ncbi:MAG: 4-hydroxy-tetrahydrodipicolinate synthase [Marinilabiliaceae bacterium]|nr:4-hydroxy-tetrahydrodipicolinate synthase [Marinilabiliaceae bacterium]
MGISNLKGSIVAIITPFKDNGELDLEAFDQLIEFHISNKTDGIVVCGTTGETPALSEEEDAIMIKRAVDKVAGRVPVIAGTGSNSTHDCIKYTQKAKDLGVDAALVVVPYYNKPTDAGMYLHFSSVAKAVDIPIILYNVPGRTGSNIKPAVVLKLANDFKNIVGIKEAQGNLSVVAELIANRPNGFKIYSGDDFTSMSTNYIGADGCISVIANIIPLEFHNLMHLSIKNEVIPAQELFFKYRVIMDLMFVESNPIPVKTALAIMGKVKEVFRSPLCEMDSVNRLKLENELKKIGVI